MGLIKGMVGVGVSYSSGNWYLVTRGHPIRIWKPSSVAHVSSNMIKVSLINENYIFRWMRTGNLINGVGGRGPNMFLFGTRGFAP